MKHKLRIWHGEQLPLWYVECRCGWEPEPSKSDGLHGRKFWGIALAVGREHLMEQA